MDTIDTYELDKVFVEEKQEIFDSNLNVYYRKEKDDPKDRIEIEIGDSKDKTKVFPQAKFQRWDNEVNVSFRFDSSFIDGNESSQKINGIIEWLKGNYKAKFYPINDTPDGGYKFCELVIPSRPPVNQFNFSVESKRAIFEFQKQFTLEQQSQGFSMPDDIVGSYVIRDTRHNGLINKAGKNYHNGKMGHLYRPKFIDALGDECWGEFNDDLNFTGRLSIKVDPEWLDKAVYPVTMDPVLGNTYSGSSSQQIAQSPSSSYLVGLNFNLTADGQADKITIALKGTVAETLDITVSVYKKDGNGADSHSLIATAERENLSITSSYAWYEFTLGGETLTAGEYILSVVGNGEEVSSSNVYVAVDAYTYPRNRYYTSASGAGSYNSIKGSDPWSQSPTSNTNMISSYLTYTADESEIVTEEYFRSLDWVAPVGVESILIELFGAGGGGGDRSTNGAAGGGGGGAYAASTVAVTPESTYAVVVAAAEGSSSTFDTDVVVAVGGSSVATNSTTGGAGGSAGSCTGDVTASGGSGGNSSASVGGGGGESGGSSGTGDSGNSGATGGAGGSGVNDPGGDGGAGRSGTQGGGVAGDVPGGAGGGAYRTSLYQGGGAGKSGMAIITYTAPAGGGTAYDETYTEAIAPVDSVLKTGSRLLTDVITHVDSFISASVFARTLSEAIATVDSIIHTTSRILTDAVAHVDVLDSAKVALKTLTDVVTPVDTVIKTIARTFSDAVAHVDSIITASVFARTLSEATTAIDSFLRSIARTITETISNVDVFDGTKVTSKVLSDATALTDTIIRTISRTLTDITSLVDTVTRSIGRTLTEAASIADTILKTVSRTLSEVVTQVDTLTKTTSNEWTKTLSETTTAIDSFLRGIHRTLSESLSLHDRVVRYTKWFNRTSQNWYNQASNWYTKLTGSWRDPLE